MSPFAEAMTILTSLHKARYSEKDPMKQRALELSALLCMCELAPIIPIIEECLDAVSDFTIWAETCAGCGCPKHHCDALKPPAIKCCPDCCHIKPEEMKPGTRVQVTIRVVDLG